MPVKPRKEGREDLKHVGQLIQQRREAMGLSLAALSKLMGGYPSTSLMSRIESGEVPLTAKSATQYADVMNLPRHLFLNAAWIATAEQHEAAMVELSRMLGEEIPVYVNLPVLDPSRPDLNAENPTRRRELRKQEDAFLVDLRGKEHAPYEGEVLAFSGRKPKEGQGVVAEVSGVLGAWTFHTSRPTGEWLENGTGEKVTRFKVWGVIGRVQPPALELE